MKVLVAIKRVVDYNIKVNIKSDGSGLDIDRVKTIVNPFDENALEEAVRLKESGKVTEVVAVTIGTSANQDILRHALAMGADRALLLETDVEVQSLAVAKLLKALVEKEQPDLILLGKQAIDDDAGQAGQMLSALLGYPQGTFVSEITLDSGQVQVTREIDGGTENLTLNLPAVLTADLRLNEPRFIKLPDLMRARKKALETQPAADLGIDISPRLATIAVNDPPTRKAGIKVDSVDDLLNRLRNDEGFSL